MIGEKYWTTGIILNWYEYSHQWSAKLEFYDNGFCEKNSTEGTLQLRYWQVDPTEMVKTLLDDARKLGIVPAFDAPMNLYYRGDGEDKDNPPPQDWRRILSEIANETGLVSVYVLAPEMPAPAPVFHAGDAGYSDGPESPQVDEEGALRY